MFDSLTNSKKIVEIGLIVRLLSKLFAHDANVSLAAQSAVPKD